MIKFIKGVREDILQKDIYIWNVNASSMRIFYTLGMMLVDIRGFVVHPETNCSTKETIMNRPLISIEEFNKKDNAVLITADYCITIKDIKFPANTLIYKYNDDIFEIDRNLYKKKVYIYGTGNGAKKLTNYLNNEGVKVRGYITTDFPSLNTGEEGYCPKKYNAKDFSEDDVIIISTLNWAVSVEILEHCIEAICDVYVYCDVYNFLGVYPGNMHLDSIYNLDRGLTEGKKIFYLTKYPHFDSQIIKFLELFGFEIINKNCYNLENLYEIMELDKYDFIIVINEPDVVERIQILESLSMFGFSLSNNNVIGCQIITNAKEFLLKENDYLKDTLCGHAQKYESVKFCGWKILKKDNLYKLKIMILGGSTSTEELYYPETWMKKLYKKLHGLDLNCTFYIGASAGYRVTHEFLRFLRDGHIIRPDIVISMSGINDAFTNEFNNKFNLNFLPDFSGNDYSQCIMGLPSNENCYEYWCRIEKIFKLYTDFFNIKFFPFLQPMNLRFTNALVECKMVTEDESLIISGKDFCENANEDDIYTNLIDLFYNQPEMFIDGYHYSDKAADVLSDKVLETILPTVKEIYAGK